MLFFRLVCTQHLIQFGLLVEPHILYLLLCIYVLIYFLLFAIHLEWSVQVTKWSQLPGSLVEVTSEGILKLMSVFNLLLRKLFVNGIDLYQIIPSLGMGHDCSIQLNGKRRYRLFVFGTCCSTQ